MIVKKCCFPSESTMYIHIYIYICPNIVKHFWNFTQKHPFSPEFVHKNFVYIGFGSSMWLSGIPVWKKVEVTSFRKKKQIPNLGGGDYNKWRLHISGWLKSENADLGGGNSNIFVFSSRKLGKMNPFWRAYISDGLKPPTSNILWKIPKNLEQW